MVRELSALFQVLHKKGLELLDSPQDPVVSPSVKFDFRTHKLSREFLLEPQVSEEEGNTSDDDHDNSQRYIVDFYDAFRYVEVGIVCVEEYACIYSPTT